MLESRPPTHGLASVSLLARRSRTFAKSGEAARQAPPGCAWCRMWDEAKARAPWGSGHTQGGSTEAPVIEQQPSPSRVQRFHTPPRGATAASRGAMGPGGLAHSGHCAAHWLLAQAA
jgi:hypothetical protein